MKKNNLIITRMFLKSLSELFALIMMNIVTIQLMETSYPKL